MGELPSAGPEASLRARRWDAIVLGGALPGLVAAARLGMAGHRVLVIEEEAAARRPDLVREPFLLCGTGDGVLGQLLRALSLPLIDVRRMEPDPLAYQVVLPDARIDVGDPAHTAEELVAWGLAKPDAAQELLRSLSRASLAEADAMLSAPVVRSGGLRSLGRSAKAPPRHARGMPLEAAKPPPELAPFFDAQVRALSNLGHGLPSPEARARLLGAALQGGAAFPTGELSLRTLLRQRVRAVHGEFRHLGEGFSLVNVGNQPGLARARAHELWVGRALIVNAPRGLLASVLRDADAAVPAFLDVSAPAARRCLVHLHAPLEVVPEGMCRRVVCLGDRERPPAGTNLVTLAVHPPAGPGQPVDLVAAAAVDPGETGAEDAIEETVRGLMPFCGERLERLPVPAVRWDEDQALEDPAPGSGWPAETEIRIATRPPLYELPRSALAGLGLEGDLLLGWRAGDRIATELA